MLVLNINVFDLQFRSKNVSGYYFYCYYYCCFYYYCYYYYCYYYYGTCTTHQEKGHGRGPSEQSHSIEDSRPDAGYKPVGIPGRRESRN